MKNPNVQLYYFASQRDLIDQMQETSLAREDLGLAPEPLVASAAWWDALERGELRGGCVDGAITNVWWGSMADWPEVEIRDANGHLSTWTREGDPRRYAKGLGARVTFVEHPWKHEAHGLGPHARLVLEIWVEESTARSSGLAPGPGGAGYELSRRHGEATHYVAIAERDRGEDLLAEFERVGRAGRVWGGGTPAQWIVQVWAPRAAEAQAEAAKIDAVARRFGGRYDGGEIVGGQVWGPLDAE